MKTWIRVDLFRARVRKGTWLAALCLLTTAAAQADDYTYTTNFPDTNTITITGYTGPGGDVSIPSTLAGKTVTVIGDYAFNDCYNLTNVTISSNVTAIGQWAFGYCTSLTNAAIPNSVTALRRWAFGFCSSLAKVTIPDSVTTIEGVAFGYCVSLTDITIPDHVSSLDGAAFAGCTNLSAITVGPGNAAYSSAGGVLFNKDLTTLLACPGGKTGSYTIPDSVTGIAGDAGGGLTEIILGTGVTSIADGAIAGAPRLTTITVAVDNPHYSSVAGVLFNKDQTAIVQYPGGRAGSYTIPDGVISIEGHTFYMCHSLTSLTIPASLSDIGGGFGGCDSLTNITVAAGNVVYSSLGGVVFNQSQTKLVQYPPGLSGSYIVPDGVTTIGNSAFYRSYGLDSVTIPKSVTLVENRAFYACGNLAGAYFEGNAPIFTGGSWFTYTDTTIYYLKGTSDWQPTAGDRQTAPWPPRVDAGDMSFGVQTNGFGFNIGGASGMVFLVEASTNLLNPAAWSLLQSNTLSGRSAFFNDAEWNNHPKRFYRLRSP